MNSFWLTLVSSLFFLGIAVVGICIRIILKKNGKFGGTCASNSPFLNKEGKPCSFCGAVTNQECKQ